jgi:hypothetical protein
MTATRTFIVTFTETTPSATPRASAARATFRPPRAAPPTPVDARARAIRRIWEELETLVGQDVGGAQAVPMGAVEDELWRRERRPNGQTNAKTMFEVACLRAGLARVEFEGVANLIKPTMSAGGMS